MTETKPLLSFFGKPELKQKYVDRLQEHRKLEHLIQGTGWEEGKGCAIGCTLEAYNHSLFPTELGLPEWLARLIDTTFEGLPKGGAEQFAEDVLQAIPVGVDIEPVRHKVAIRRLTRLLDIVPKSDQSYCQKVIDAIQQVILYHRNPSDSAAESAAAKAWSAARSAALSAGSTRSAAESAALSAALSAGSAGSAAESARSAAALSTRSTAYKEMAEDLIKELQEAK